MLDGVPIGIYLLLMTSPTGQHGETQMTAAVQTNMPWAVYRGDRLRRGETPRNEVLVSGHLSLDEAMEEANRMKRLDGAHTYAVGAA